MTRCYQNLSDNCLQACVASILELPLNSVPHVFANGGPGYRWTSKQWLTLVNWARKKGYRTIYLDRNLQRDQRELKKLERSGRYYIGFGETPTTRHAVVMKGGRVVFDPDLHSRGIIGEPGGYLAFKRRRRPLRLLGLFLLAYWIVKILRGAP